MKTYLALALLTHTVPASLMDIKSCLLNYTFYHPETDTCQGLLDDYDCPPGQWMAPEKNRVGVVNCEDRQEDEECLHPGVMGLTNHHTIGCQDKQLLEHMEMFQTSECENGEILMPNNFEEDTLPCPDKFACIEDYSQYLKLPSLEQLNEINFFKSITCSKEPKKICLPLENKNFPLTPENIYSTFISSSLKCSKNPCQEGYWPWIEEEEGYQRCIPIDATCNTATLRISKEDGELKCSPLVPFNVIGLCLSLCLKRT